MTDKQIIKYWNEIDSEIINEHGEEFDVYITMPVAKSTVDFINRQKAEINRLKKEQRRALNCVVGPLVQNTIKAAKKSAIKEFAERLKNNTFLAKEKNSVEHTIWIYEIDKIVEEMTEV